MLETRTERVLVVPTALFNKLGYFQGFSSDAREYLAELLSPRHTSFRPRDEVEEDPGYKQLIPYCLFRHRDERGVENLFYYTRGKGQGERRLHLKRSIGVGGHISSDDVAPTGLGDPYREGMRREVAEEVAIDAEQSERCIGLINDDETPVGKVHLGVVHLFDLAAAAVTPREVDIADSGFSPLHQLLADSEGFESWSQICLAALSRGID